MHNDNKIADLDLIFRKFLHDLGNISSGVVTAVDFIDNNNNDVSSSAKLLLSQSSKLLYAFIKIYHLLIANTGISKMREYIETLFVYKNIDYSFDDLISVCSGTSMQYYILFIYDTMNQGGKIIANDKKITAIYNSNNVIASGSYKNNIWYKYLASQEDIKVTSSSNNELVLESV